jgi:hypothetical protein
MPGQNERAGWRNAAHRPASNARPQTALTAARPLPIFRPPKIRPLAKPDRQRRENDANSHQRCRARGG